MAIRGSLREASLPDVLQLLALGKKTGCLSIAHKSNFGSIYFTQGRICYASIVNRRDRLGDIMVKNGLLSQGQLDRGVELRLRDEPPLHQDVAEPVAPVDDRGVADPPLVEVYVAEVVPVRDAQASGLLPHRQELEHVGEARLLEASLDGH